MKNRIIMSNRQNKIILTPQTIRLIKSAVNTALEYEGFERKCEISVTFVDNETIHEINKSKRGIDRPTDVLSFPIYDDDFSDGECCVLGDIVISLEKAFEQAGEYGHSFDREVAFLIVHSVLHLLGYDHETSLDDEKDMFWRQEEIMKIMGLTR